MACLSPRRRSSVCAGLSAAMTTFAYPPSCTQATADSPETGNYKLWIPHRSVRSRVRAQGPSVRPASRTSTDAPPQEHPAVLESAAVASPDPARGEIVKAFVVLSSEYAGKGDPKLTAELQKHCREATAPFKYPREVSRCPQSRPGTLLMSQTDRVRFGAPENRQRQALPRDPPQSGVRKEEGRRERAQEQAVESEMQR